MWIIFVIIGAIISAWLGYRYAKSQIKIQQHEIDAQYQFEKDRIENELYHLEKEKVMASNHLQELRSQAEEAGQMHYNKTMELVNNNIANDIDALEKEYENYKTNYKDEFLALMRDMTTNFSNAAVQQQQALDEIKARYNNKVNELLNISSQVDAAVESNKRALLDETDNQFYRCMISELFQKEIKHLRSVEPYLADTRPLCKIIWESYYRNSCSSLLDRLTKGAKISGIYKITNLENNKVYIGQAVNIADRLRTHIKAGIGIDPTNSELYKDMKKIGVENFTFEILEECTQAQLNDKEKFWISFYHGQDFGYNITKGGSQRISN